MREIQATGSSSAQDVATMSDANKAKLDKLASRISADYVRAKEWSAQKRALSHALWRKVHAHYNRVVDDMKKIHPDLVASVSSTVQKAPEVVPRRSLVTALAEAGYGEQDLEVHDTKTKRKRSIGGPSSEYTRGTSATVYSAGRQDYARTHRTTPALDEYTPVKEREPSGLGDHEDERDENLYCFCQRGSFGEMIGCDSDECKFEWVRLHYLRQFHIGCVGVSKPLPQTWVCSDCLAKNKKRRRG